LNRSAQLILLALSIQLGQYFLLDLPKDLLDQGFQLDQSNLLNRYFLLVPYFLLDPYFPLARYFPLALYFQLDLLKDLLGLLYLGLLRQIREIDQKK
jgi:hypothetical protein